MRKIILLVLVTIASFTIHAQEKTIIGIVTEGSYPIPGVNINIKGTTTGTQTDFDGNYTIKAQVGDILVFSFVGYVTEEIITTTSNRIDVALKPDENIFFCNFFSKPKQIGINYYGSIDNTPYGLLLNYYHPYLEVFNSEISFETKFGYQTDFKVNKQLYLELLLDNIIPNLNNFDIRILYNNIENKSYQFQKYQIQANTDFYVFERSTIAYLGFGISEFNSKNWQAGYEIGIGQNLSLGIEIYSKVTFWNSFWQFQNGLDWTYRNFNLFVEHDKIDNYSNFNVGIGYNIIL